MTKWRFGKYKDQEVKNMVVTTKGLSYCQWYLDQPINEKYKEQEEKFRSHVAECMGGRPPQRDTEVVKEKAIGHVLEIKLDVAIDLLRDIAKNTAPVKYNATQNDCAEIPTCLGKVVAPGNVDEDPPIGWDDNDTKDWVS